MALLDARPAAPPSAPDDRGGLLARIGRAAARHPRRVIAIWVVLVVAAAPLAVKKEEIK